MAVHLRLRGKGFIIHNERAYHVTSDIYPDWLIKVVANESITIEPLQCTIVFTGDYIISWGRSIFRTIA
jgi:hypothetical protein